MSNLPTFFCIDLYVLPFLVQGRIRSDFWYDIILSRWQSWCPFAAAYATVSARYPLARRALVMLFARSVWYSLW